ncbi:mycothione reductase [Corynebacterium yudongzhengii]|uniref:Mycothione reductase n=1 Tax=Corynebacterium yudongzhengii TaxID=2080740 RepID=A0A2U1T669_9CORY|nr:mycothione reductase [Corynebacterium yudongzhengii]AWB81700.1 mycothione reductase [Corynebacterium yudongzhengii]PWC01497.1 mycothione reductase [Corynebacterium yudongzhengii]
MTNLQIDEHYDLIIIGTGSGNSLPDERFDDQRIAIVEKSTFGGTCLNVGCIPTKMYVYAADTAYAARHSEKLNISTTYESADWPNIIDRVFHNRIDKIAQGGEDYRRGDETPNIDVYDHHARFIAPKTLATGIGGDKKVISGEQIVLAAGSRPVIPEVIAESGVPYETNETVMRLDKQPESMIILGGGFIAMEFAHVFEALGTKVTVINRSPLLRKLDHDITERFNDIVRERFDARIGRTIAAARREGSGVVVTLDDGSEVAADSLLVATGRRPNGDQMDLDKAGIEMLDDGRVRVDDYGRTTAAGVWALGDVSSPYQLKHVANAEARAVQHNLLHPDDLQAMPHDNVPSAIFTHPQIATVGLSESEARDAGYDVTVKVQAYGDVAYGWAMEDHHGVVKLIADRKSGRLLGAHLMGPQASTLIQQLITVMAYDISLRDFARRQYWIHPALPEVIENAVLGLEFA